MKLVLIRDADFLQYLRNCLLVEEDSAPQQNMKETCVKMWVEWKQ